MREISDRTHKQAHAARRRRHSFRSSLTSGRCGMGLCRILTTRWDCGMDRGKLKKTSRFEDNLMQIISTGRKGVVKANVQ